MSDVVNVDVLPGYYIEDQIINISFGDQVKEISINKNGRPPSISKYIAYDTLSPPNPFIAVSEDGAGRVVYDGGLESLRADAGGGGNLEQAKYIVNVLDWISDPTKTVNGNKSILILSDVAVGDPYRIDLSGGDHFGNSISLILQTGGYTGSVIKITKDYPNNLLDARFSELNQYAAVFLVSIKYLNTKSYTDRFIDDLVRYRESGGGIFIKTDHGPNHGTIESAIGNHDGFFGTANAITTRFGAWFSGSYNRTPVNAGFLRRTYGDHPLYRGFLDSESIPAGRSESRVFITSDPTQPPSDLQYHATEGLTTINIMAILHDGSMVPHKLEYHVVDSATLFTIKGTDYGHGQIVDIGADNYIDMDLTHVGVDIAMEADLFLDEVKIGTVSKELDSPVTWTPLNGDSNRIHINNNTTITLVYTNPTGFESTIYIRRDTVPYFEVEDLIYPKYDELLTGLLSDQHTAPVRLEQSAGIRREVMTLPRIVRYSKDNLNRIYGDMEPTYVVGVARLSDYVGTNWNHSGGFRSSGSLFPDGPFAAINSRSNVQLFLDLVSRRSEVQPEPLAVYMDNIGPLYMTRSFVGGEGETRHRYSNGVTNIYQYLEERIGQHVEFRFLYQED